MHLALKKRAGMAPGAKCGVAVAEPRHIREPSSEASTSSERWAEALSSLFGSLWGVLLDSFGSVLGGVWWLFGVVLGRPAWRKHFSPPGGRIFALGGSVWKRREAGYSNESLVFSVFGKLCRPRVRVFA